LLNAAWSWPRAGLTAREVIMADSAIMKALPKSRMENARRSTLRLDRSFVFIV
jgi:hypothetical protein